MHQMDRPPADTIMTERAKRRPRRVGHAPGVFLLVVVATIVTACGGTLPSGLPSLPALPSFQPSLPALPSLPTAPKPTTKPTEKPTEKPTPKPTEKPTAQPTTKPTGKPTEAPTPGASAPATEPAAGASATPKPTAKPTAKPSPSATAKPTAKPSASESATPTPTPSPTPTPTPTPSPTPSPAPTPAIATAIQAAFIASSLSGDAPLLVRFSDLSSGDPTNELWTFGDGDVSLQSEPIHVYQASGLYTVTLTVLGANGSDTRIKRDLIAVGSAAELLAERQDPEFIDTPAFWLTMAISPPVAVFLGIRDHVDRQRQDGQELVTDGHALVALIEGRAATTSEGAVDLAIEKFMDKGTRARHRLDGLALENLDRSSTIAEDLQRALLVELAVRSVSPDDTRLTAMNLAIQDRVEEFASAIDGLDRATQ
jgi:PKD repeat protein